jgi:hypothetical protein
LNSRKNQIGIAIAAVVFSLGRLAFGEVGGTNRVLAEWNFGRPGVLQGWQPNADLTNVVVTNGALSCRAVGNDPILALRPLLDLQASPWQVVELRLKADRDGTAELFWSNTPTGRYGGFAQEKSTRFNVAGDSQWHSYRLLPCWHSEGRIVRLRFDVYDAARFELDFLRVVELAMPPAAAGADFDFSTGNQGWQWFDTSDSRITNRLGMVGRVCPSAPERSQAQTARWDRRALPPSAWEGNQVRSTPTGLLLSPPLDINATDQNFVSVRMAADRGRHAILFFLTEQGRGLHGFTFPIEADGRGHTYNLDLLAAKDWRGRVIGLGLRPSDAINATTTLRSLAVSDAPQGPPQLKVVAFALEDALPHVGRPAQLVAVLENTGGQMATNVRAKLELPRGVKLLASLPPDSRLAALGFGEEAKLTWTVQAGRPLEGKVHLKVAAAYVENVTTTTPVRFTPRLAAAKTNYVPEPKPVRGPLEVGVYYFPGWKTASQWQPIQRFPERKPVLGWYREGEPEIADWHIKWAVEHGITFFAYDWYWNRGARQLEHALHDGYFKARYRHLLKFCLLWANHNPPHTSSHEDCLAVTRYWIENYFRRPEHLTFDGKPVMIIFSPHRLAEDLGSEGVKRAFEAMRSECQHAGLKGLYLIACVGDAGGARAAAAEGYDAVTAYNWPHLGMTGEGMFAPFETLVPAYRRQWEHLLAEIPIPLLPLPVCGGWDSRPWHGENNLVRFGRTPELFKRHLLDAKQVLEIRNQESGEPLAQPRSGVSAERRQLAVLGPRLRRSAETPLRQEEFGAAFQTPKAVIIEAWNEWGEGSYIEPHSEFGFGYLDAIRDVFTDAPKAHDDVTPADVGLGPYDVPPPPPAKTSWEFDSSDDGWSNTMQLSELKVAEGVLSARTVGNDPAIFGPPMQARASEFGTVVIRLRLARADSAKFTDSAQLFWRTSRLPESESSSVRFPVQGDGQWHEPRVPVSQNPRWRGVITRLRLDPCNQPNVKVELDFIRLVE